MSSSLHLGQEMVSTEQLQPLLAMPDISVSIDPTAVTISCPKCKLEDIISSLPTSLVDSVRITAHTLPPIPHTGAGQVITLDTSLRGGVGNINRFFFTK